MQRITFIRPDDWHLHVRSGEMLCAVLPCTARQFGRAIIMPNLMPPVTRVEQAKKYHLEILAMLPSGSNFEPLMTLYLTDDTSPEEITKAKNSGIVQGIKLYPKGATTNSNSGVTDIRKVHLVLERMEREGMPLLVHGEVTETMVDIFDREKRFIDSVLEGIINDFPWLKIVLEHVTTKDGVDFVKEAGNNLAATITAHHLFLNRNDILVGGIKPHNYCLPVAKREVHRLALVEAATSGHKKFFLGTDSAPHLRLIKEATCGCAGCFTALSATELYLQMFDMEGKLENFEAFASLNGPDFYELPRNTSKVTYERVSTPWFLPEKISVGDNGEVVPFAINGGLNWKLVG